VFWQYFFGEYTHKLLFFLQALGCADWQHQGLLKKNDVKNNKPGKKTTDRLFLGVFLWRFLAPLARGYLKTAFFKKTIDIFFNIPK
jgi:hypothetical protein